MTIWLIIDGEKAGPFEDYEVREMIREGKVTAETRAWHAGAESWMAVREIEVLAGEFDLFLDEDDPPPEPIQVHFAPFRAWRRFGARFFDLLVYVTIINIFAHLAELKPPNPEEVSGWSIIWILLPAILMEAALVSSVGFTPGKWLMGLRVRTIFDAKLTTGQAIVRSLRVWVLGLGMLHPILMALGHALTLFFGLKKGAPLWDLQSGFHVPGAKLTGRRIVAYFACIVLLLGIRLAMNWDEF